MAFGFTILLLCQLAGETLARGLGLPVPGPVLGLVILVIGLHAAHRRPPGSDGHLETRRVTRVADGLLANLSLLFVPAGVGTIAQFATLRAQAVALGLALIVSTLLTLLATVFVFVAVKRLVRGAPAETAR